MAWIVGRKFVYLKKLNPEAFEGPAAQDNFWTEFFPGLAVRLQGSNTREHWLNFLAEFEKFLRRLRLLSLKIDTATNGMIHRVRKSAVNHEVILNNKLAAEMESRQVAAEIINGKSKKDPKEEEQRLIIEIAQNPKNAELYKKLGNIYMKTAVWQDAVESFKKAVELNPEDQISQAKLERVLKKLEKMPT